MSEIDELRFDELRQDAETLSKLIRGLRAENQRLRAALQDICDTSPGTCNPLVYTTRARAALNGQ